MSLVDTQRMIDNTQETHSRKLLALGLHETRHPPPEKVIFNLSDRTLDPLEKSTLARGLNFALNPGRPRATQFFLPFERLFSSLSAVHPYKEDETHIFNELKTLIWQTYRTLSKSRGPNNLTKEQVQSLRTLSRDTTILVSRLDKGQGVAILNRNDYSAKIHQIIGDNSKFELVNVPQSDHPLKLIFKIEDKTKRLLKKLNDEGVISDGAHWRATPCGSNLGHIYGLPKIHKVGTPLRPVISAVGTHNHQLAKELVPVFNRLVTDTHTVRDSFDFVKTITNFRLDSSQTGFMATADVTALFTNIPVRETIDIILNLAFSNNSSGTYEGFTRESMTSLLENLTYENYFSFEDKVYRQIDGVSMGGPLSCAMANIFMAHHESVWLRECPAGFKPLYYGRYVDDIFAIFADSSHAKNFFEYLNGKHEAIKFTWEHEINQTLPFLDINVHRHGGSFETSLYRKKTFTGLSTNFDSYIPQKYKTNLLDILLFRAKMICSSAVALSNEYNFIRNYLFENNFPLKLLEGRINNFKQNLDIIKPVFHTAEKAMKIPIICQFQGEASKELSAKLRSSLDRYYPHLDFRLIFVNNHRIKSFFPSRPRGPIGMTSGAIYLYSCGGCSS